MTAMPPVPISSTSSWGGGTSPRLLRATSGARGIWKRSSRERRTDQTSGQSDQKTTAEKLGEEFKVGEKTIRRDGKFAEAVDQIITNCGQDAKNLILSRDSGLTRGMVVRLAKLKPAEQQQYLRTLKESGKRPRKAKKGKKRERLTLIRVPTQPKALVQTLLEKLGSKELDDVSRMLEEAIAKRNQEPKEKESEPTPRRKGKTEK